MRQRAETTLYEYWSKLKGERIAPRRFDIEPSRIAGILPHTFILETVATGRYHYRIAGTAICEAYGCELREENYLTRWTSGDRIALSRALAHVSRGTHVVQLTVTARTATGLSLGLIGLLLPLVHTDDTIDRIIGCLQPTTMPDWLGLEPLVEQSLSDLDLVAAIRDSTIPDPTVAKHRPGPQPGPRSDRIADAHPLFRGSAPALGTELLRNVPRDPNSRRDSRMARGDRNDHEDRSTRLANDALSDRQSPFDAHVRNARIVRSDRRQFRVYDGGLSKIDE